MKQIVWTISLICLALFTKGQAVEYSATSDTNRIRIGEQFRYSVRIQASENQTVAWQNEVDTMGRFEIIDGPAIDSSINNGSKEYRLNYTLTAWDTGYFILFPLPILVDGDTVHAEPVFMDVVFVDAIPEEPHDIKERWDEPWRWWEIAGIVGILLLLAAVVYLIIRRLRNRKPAEAPVKVHIPTIDPLEWVRNEIAALRSEKLYLYGLDKQFFTRLANIPRTYAEMTMDIAALEMPSAEFLSLLKTKTEVSAAELQSLKNILSMADMAKFAKGKFDAERCEDALNKLEAIIGQWHSKQAPKQET
jgi:hypothetical protein